MIYLSFLSLILGVLASAQAGPPIRGQIELSFGDQVITTIERDGMRLQAIERAVEELKTKRAAGIVVYSFERDRAAADFVNWSRRRRADESSTPGYVLTLRLFDAEGEIQSAVMARGSAALREFRLGPLGRWFQRAAWRARFSRPQVCRRSLTTPWDLE